MCRESAVLVIRNTPFSHQFPPPSPFPGDRGEGRLSLGPGPRRAGDDGLSGVYRPGRGREAVALPCLRASRLDGGRGEGGLFLRTRGFQGLRRSIVFRQVFRSSATKMSPAGPSHDNFLVLDFESGSGLSFFCEGRQRFPAECEGKYFAEKKESLSMMMRCKGYFLFSSPFFSWPFFRSCGPSYP
jgi:hypothetical protein